MAPSGERLRSKAGVVFVAGKTVRSMPERFKVVCIPCKALYKCSALLYFTVVLSANITEQIGDDDDDDGGGDVTESAILARIGQRELCGCPEQDRPVCTWLLAGFVEFESPCIAMCSYVSLLFSLCVSVRVSL